MVIYHQDETPLSSLQFPPPQNHDHLLEITTYDQETEVKYRGLIQDAQAKLQSSTELAQREVYDACFNSYLDKDWTRCKILCHLWIRAFPADPLVNGLAEQMYQHNNFICPNDWPGQQFYHEMTSKWLDIWRSGGFDSGDENWDGFSFVCPKYVYTYMHCDLICD